MNKVDNVQRSLVTVLVLLMGLGHVAGPQFALARAPDQNRTPPIKLGKVQRYAKLGLSIQPLVGLPVFEEHDNSVVFGGQQLGFYVGLGIGPLKDLKLENPTNEKVLAKVLEMTVSSSEVFTVNKTFATTVGRKKARGADFVGKIFNDNSHGRLIVSILDAERVFVAVGASQTKDDMTGEQHWKRYGSKAFAAVLKTVKFFAPVSAQPAPALTVTPATKGNITSACPVSSDPTYGYSKDNPIQVGGDFLEGPRRERAYLDTLRGPNGEALSYERLGSTAGKDGIVDIYTVTYANNAALFRLHIDMYRFAPLQAPRGFICAEPFALSAPS